jgi:hypothetical protein
LKASERAGRESSLFAGRSFHNYNNNNNYAKHQI